MFAPKPGPKWNLESLFFSVFPQDITGKILRHINHRPEMLVMLRQLPHSFHHRSVVTSEVLTTPPGSSWWDDPKLSATGLLARSRMLFGIPALRQHQAGSTTNQLKKPRCTEGSTANDCKSDWHFLFVQKKCAPPDWYILIPGDQTLSSFSPLKFEEIHGLAGLAVFKFKNRQNFVVLLLIQLRWFHVIPFIRSNLTNHQPQLIISPGYTIQTYYIPNLNSSSTPTLTLNDIDNVRLIIRNPI